VLGCDVVVYLVEVFGGKGLDLGLEDAVEIVLRKEEGDVVLLAEAVQHLLIPLGEISGAVIGEGKADLLLFGKAGAADSDHFVAVGLDHADAIYAGLLSALDSAVAGEDAVVLIDNDRAGCAVTLQGLLD